MNEKFKSRKFWVVVATALLTIANEGLGLNIPTENIIGVVGLAAAYVFGQGIADAKKEEAKGKVATKIEDLK